jgi:two-component system, NarL family, response regulator NreC
MREVITVGLIEDQFLFRQGMKAIIASNPSLRVVFESAEGYSVVDRLRSLDVLPQVLLIDYSLPSKNGREFSGVDTTRAVLESFPDMKVLILSVHNNENFITQVIERGAHGYLVKDCDPGEVFEAIETVRLRGSYVNAIALKAIQNSMNKSKGNTICQPEKAELSKREIEILMLICQQLTAEEIAEKLFISIKTVNGHRTNLVQKTGSKNMAGLVTYAIRNNIKSFETSLDS